MLCYATQCYFILCHALLCDYAVFCYGTLCFTLLLREAKYALSMRRYLVLCFANCAMFCCTMRPNAVLCWDTYYSAMLCYAVLCSVMLFL